MAEIMSKPAFRLITLLIDAIGTFMQFELPVDDLQLVALPLYKNNLAYDQICPQLGSEQHHQEQEVGGLRSADVFRFSGAESHP